MGILKHIGKIVHAGYHTGYGTVGKGIHEIIDVAIMGVKGRFVDLCLCYDIGYRDLFDRLFASHAKKGVGDGFFCFLYADIHRNPPLHCRKTTDRTESVA